ncbi:putative FAD-binding oxidoreductase [Thozetella sp. PMI_491]|nr:putative FAD-binding oxidoreductase [Thozetella sp. PMI_491]
MLITRFFRALTLAGFASATELRCPCTQLQSQFPGQVLTSDSANYTAERTAYWDVRSDQSPTCIFLPTEASQVAAAMGILQSNKAEFAVRGGGHMNFPGSNNIDNGVLIALSEIAQLDVDATAKTIDVGPGTRWVDVYGALEPYGLYCIGGRLKTIGVPGLTLIGGWHYFNNKYGYAMDNILSYDVVLANGTQVVADSATNSDLFWALKGGANNFGIVTNFKIQAFDQGLISTTIQNYGEEQVQGYIKAVCDFVESTTSEVGAGAVFSIQYNATTKAVAPGLLGVEQSDISPPPRFANFTALPSTIAISNLSTVTAWHNQFETPNQMFRVQFSHRTMKPDADQIYQFYNMWKDSVDELADVEGLYPTFVLNAAPASAAHVAQSNGVGNVWGLDDSENWLIFQLSTGWASEKDDTRITTWSQKLITQMHEMNKAKGISSEFIYMGDAGEWQDPWAGMDQNNVAKLKTIRDAYDPDGTFKYLSYGGFKLPY